jgi:hypothetical protein
VLSLVDKVLSLVDKDNLASDLAVSLVGKVLSLVDKDNLASNLLVSLVYKHNPVSNL